VKHDAGHALSAQQLAVDGIPTEVFSVRSWSELARDGVDCEQRSLAGEEGVQAFVTGQPATRRRPP
jgi:pyruvate dehydrogenase E1 component